ncbi:DUF1127 domain-containing protein [Paracoccus tibetensis]|nr:DUF1127 domain-containing protein [Paracoccus tibetensis]
MHLPHGSIGEASIVHSQRKGNIGLKKRRRAIRVRCQPDEPKGRNMAVIAQAHNTAADAGLRGRLLTAIQRMQEHRARRAVYRQTVRELNALTTRDLTDLGISRSMITRLAHEAAWGAAK